MKLNFIPYKSSPKALLSCCECRMGFIGMKKNKAQDFHLVPFLVYKIVIFLNNEKRQSAPSQNLGRILSLFHINSHTKSVASFQTRTEMDTVEYNTNIVPILVLYVNPLSTGYPEVLLTPPKNHNYGEIKISICV